MSSAICFNLDQSEILSSGKGLTIIGVRNDVIQLRLVLVLKIENKNLEDKTANKIVM